MMMMIVESIVLIVPCDMHRIMNIVWSLLAVDR